MQPECPGCTPFQEKLLRLRKPMFILLQPNPTDSRNTGAFIARQRPGYHNIKESKRMRHSSSFRGSFRPTTFSINFFQLWRYLFLYLSLTVKYERGNIKKRKYFQFLEFFSFIGLEAGKIQVRRYESMTAFCCP